MRMEIDCVAVTDHNSGAWIDRLKEALSELEQEKPEGFRPLHLLPGVEIAVQGGVHLLAIFSEKKTGTDIDRLLGAVDSAGGDSVTKASFETVVKKITEAGGIAVPAHADCDKGLFKALKGKTLEQALSCSEIFAVEVKCPDSEKPARYREMKLHWTEIVGSDSHYLVGQSERQPSQSYFTWVKMGSPSLEGLHLALLDGSLSVRPSYPYPEPPPEPPNEHAECVLESMMVGGTKYMGRKDPFNVRLNPWLNAIVGGRGTGKSSLIEFLRIALRRRNELPEGLKEEYDMYASVYQTRKDDGLLTSEAKFEVVYSKNGKRFRIQWAHDGSSPAIEEESAEGVWSQSVGDIVGRFPVRIYSQKHILHLAMRPGALLGIVDDMLDKDLRDLGERRQKVENSFLALRLKVREIEFELREKDRLIGERDDVLRKLDIFEQSGHIDVLRSFQQHRRQQLQIENWQDQWSSVGERVRQVGAEIVPDALGDIHVDVELQKDSLLLTHAEDARKRIEAIRRKLESLAAEADEAFANWTSALERSAWKRAATAAADAYESLSRQLRKEGVRDPTQYGSLVQNRQVIERKLNRLEQRKRELESLRDQVGKSRALLLQVRQELTKHRRSFLERVLENNPFVRIGVLPYGGHETEAGFRHLIQLEDGRFEKDVESLLRPFKDCRSQKEKATATRIEQKLEELKQVVCAIVEGSRSPVDQRFGRHLRNKLRPEVLDRLDTWFPEDTLDIRYSPTGDGKEFRQISVGSPGQKTAALLAFLLSYGREPLILDQPEDDLDNQLIHELIVKQIRKRKRERQIIVVTHNPNIVVNGDAELVVALAARSGRTQIECEGSLQEKKVRETICSIMEGGLEAFKERYHRITMQASDV